MLNPHSNLSLIITIAVVYIISIFRKLIHDSDMVFQWETVKRIKDSKGSPIQKAGLTIELLLNCMWYSDTL